MTKQTPRKRAIRAYMAAHGVNYTTAARALDQHTPSSDPRVDALLNALTTSDPKVINDAIRAHAPGPDPWDLHYALVVLSRDDAALTALDPVDGLLRVAVAAEAAHGHHRHSRPTETAADVCLAAIRAYHPARDAVHERQRLTQSLTRSLTTLATHAAVHTAAATQSVDPFYITEALLLLAHDLTTHLKAQTDPVTLTDGDKPEVPPHRLIVTEEPLTGDDLASLTAEEIADYYAAPDRTYTIECPGMDVARCEGWEECTTCRFLTPEQAAELDETSVAHGVEHQPHWFGWGVATGECSLTAYPDAWQDSATDLDLPAGRYAIDYDWNESCDLFLLR